MIPCWITFLDTPKRQMHGVEVLETNVLREQLREMQVVKLIFLRCFVLHVGIVRTSVSLRYSVRETPRQVYPHATHPPTHPPPTLESGFVLNIITCISCRLGSNIRTIVYYSIRQISGTHPLLSQARPVRDGLIMIVSVIKYRQFNKFRIRPVPITLTQPPTDLSCFFLPIKYVANFLSVQAARLVERARARIHGVDRFVLIPF